jgi:hypothetical protein
LDLAHRVPGKRVHGLHLWCRSRCHRSGPRAVPLIVSDVGWSGQ